LVHSQATAGRCTSWVADQGEATREQWGAGEADFTNWLHSKRGYIESRTSPILAASLAGRLLIIREGSPVDRLAEFQEFIAEVAGKVHLEALQPYAQRLYLHWGGLNVY
jgi:hypothetical protein